MNLVYNGKEYTVPPVQLPGVEDSATLAAADITYLTAHHAHRSAFDPSWQAIVNRADVVLHEELGWPTEAKILMNLIARGSAAEIDTFGKDESYARQRVKSILGTRARQDFWDATYTQAADHGLFDMLDQVKYGLTESEAILSEGNIDHALAARQQVKQQLGTYNAIRDGIGVNKVLRIAHLAKSDKPKIVVFAGAVHIYQAALLSELADQNGDSSVSAHSLLTNPINPEVKEYGNVLWQTVNRLDTMRSWLTSYLLRRVDAADRTNVINQSAPKVQSMSTDQLASVLIDLAKR